MAIKVLLNGANGRMGRAILAAADPDRVEIVHKLDVGDQIEGAIGSVDVAIDFSHASATLPLVRSAARHGKAVVIGTTGHSEADRNAILELKNSVPIVWSGNYSIGMNLLFHLSRIAARALPESYEPEITEAHHHFKKDAPSGTALDLVRRICEGRGWDAGETVLSGRSGDTGERPRRQIGVHALRGGDVVGEHRVSFFGEGERIELKHLATDRRIFAEGALASALWVVGKAPGFYEMQDVLKLR